MASPVDTQTPRLGETAGFATTVLSCFPTSWEVSLSRAFGEGFLVVARRQGIELRAARETAAKAAIDVLEQIARFAPIGEHVQLPLPIER